jgi:hypothetical protein
MYMNTPTPLRNAIVAALYIALIVSAINWFGSMFENTEDTIMAPMVMLSLFVLSAAIMGYLFVYEPVRLYLDGRKEEALPFFAKTVGVFACCALVFVVLLFVMPRRPLVEAPEDPGGVACTMEAKICPDGSSVGRVGPNCEFAPCPTPEFF